MVSIEIDGRTVEAEEGAMIIEAADGVGITIPRFCYHKKLSIAANCRMCLVEVDKVPKALPACATPVSEGMQVFTKTEAARKAQKAVMEFLLINHPLDCPICDQGGQCELQDVAMGYGSELSRYSEGKRSVKDKDIGSLVSTEMTRCIHCTRCVRFGEEVAGVRELGVTYRGEDAEIGTYVEKALRSEVSGNIIDLCPVGALTSKPFRFRARAWEMGQMASIAAHDCLGSNIYCQTQHNKVLKVSPKENEGINEVWLSDRDRFSYLGLRHEDRIASPMVKREDGWQETDWQSALDEAIAGLQKILNGEGADKLAGLISPNATLEEHTVFQKLLRGVGSNHIDHRLHQLDFSDQVNAPLYPGCEISLGEIENTSAMLLIGADVHREQPLLGLRIRKAGLNDSTISSINPRKINYNFSIATDITAHPNEFIANLAGVAKSLLTTSSDSDMAALLKDVVPSEHHKNIALSLEQSSKPLLILGAYVNHHPHAAQLRALARWIADKTNGAIATMSDGANSAGAWLAGCVPHRLPGGDVINQSGKNILEICDGDIKGFILSGIEPDQDCAYPAKLLEALSKADFVLALSPYVSPSLLAHAHIILPTAPFSETSGTYVNAFGDWQSFQGVTLPLGLSRPGWKVLRVLANLLKVEECDYQSSDEIRDECKEQVKSISDTQAHPYLPARLASSNTDLTCLIHWPIYRTDNITRRSAPLQKTNLNEPVAILMNSQLAEKNKFNDGQKIKFRQSGNVIELPIKIDNSLVDNTVLIPSGYEETASLGLCTDPIEMKG